MRLATFLPPGSDLPTPGEVRDQAVVAFAEIRTGIRERLASNDLSPADGERWSLDEVTLLAPIPDPPTVFGIGLNYRSHADEVGLEHPEAPVVFLKSTGSVTRPSGPVRCPGIVKRLDYEGELGVVIGAGGKVAGYTVANDLTARDLQRREPQWVRGKGGDTFCPYGPWIVTADEIADPYQLTLRTWVNGELRQQAAISDQIFRIDQVIDFISQACTLRPGDLILTGTPSGVGMAMKPRRFLAPGDTVRIEIEQIGAIEHSVVP